MLTHQRTQAIAGSEEDVQEIHDKRVRDVRAGDRCGRRDGGQRSQDQERRAQSVVHLRVGYGLGTQGVQSGDEYDTVRIPRTVRRFRALRPLVRRVVL